MAAAVFESTFIPLRSLLYEYSIQIPLSVTVSQFTEQLLSALFCTLRALQAWLLLVFELWRLLTHTMLLLYPSMQLVVSGSYRHWNSFDLSVQLCIIVGIIFFILSVWVKKNDFIGRANVHCQSKLRHATALVAAKWQRVIKWVSIRSQMAGKVLPHVTFCVAASLIVYLAPQQALASYRSVLFAACLLVPTLGSYMQSKKKEKQSIESVQSWLQLWCARAAVLCAFDLLCYVMSYIPYADVSDSVELARDLLIVWLCLSQSALSMFMRQLRLHEQSDGSLVASMNRALEFALSLIRPFVAGYVFHVIRDAIYQLLIVITLIAVAPQLGCLVLGYMLPIYTSLLALRDYKSAMHNKSSGKPPLSRSWSLWKRKDGAQVQQNIDHVAQRMLDRIKYFVVFACFDLLSNTAAFHMSILSYVPLLNHTKLLLILWMQLPYVPLNSSKLYQYVVLPFRILDISHYEEKHEQGEENEEEDRKM